MVREPILPQQSCQSIKILLPALIRKYKLVLMCTWLLFDKGSFSGNVPDTNLTDVALLDLMKLLKKTVGWLCSELLLHASFFQSIRKTDVSAHPKDLDLKGEGKEYRGKGELNSSKLFFKFKKLKWIIKKKKFVFNHLSCSNSVHCF